MQSFLIFMIVLNRCSECYQESIKKCRNNSEEYIIRDITIQVDLLFEVLESCTEILKLELENVGFKKIPEYLFQNSLKIKIIKVTRNVIREIGKRTFKNLFELKVLNLSGNKIREAIKKTI